VAIRAAPVNDVAQRRSAIGRRSGRSRRGLPRAILSRPSIEDGSSEQGDAEMAEHRRAFEDEIETLKTLRDELRVQLNLAGKDARDRFAQAEASWQKLEGRAEHVAKESRGALGDVSDAARALADEIKEAYRRIRKLL
jgi:hypothetical protein